MITNLIFENILLSFFGISTHICMLIVNRKNTILPLSISYFLSDINNYISVLIAFVNVFCFLMFSYDLMNSLGIVLHNGTNYTRLFCFFAGYFNHSIFRYLVKMIRK